MPKLGTKLKNREKLGEEYGLSKNKVARYIRISKLIRFRENPKPNGLVFAVKKLLNLPQESLDLGENSTSCQIGTKLRNKENLSGTFEEEMEKVHAWQKAYSKLLESGDKK